MKYFFRIMLLCMCFIMINQISVFASEDNKTLKLYINEKYAYVNGTQYTIDASPIVKNNRTMLPIRFVAENLGATIYWTKLQPNVVEINKGNTHIIINIGSEYAIVDGKQYILDAIPFAEYNRTYLPVRFVAEKLGADVSWNGYNHEVVIELKKPDLIGLYVTMNQINYDVFDKIDKNSLNVKAKYSDGSEKYVTNYTTNISDELTSFPGKKLIKVSYTENNITKEALSNIYVEGNIENELDFASEKNSNKNIGEDIDYELSKEIEEDIEDIEDAEELENKENEVNNTINNTDRDEVKKVIEEQKMRDLYELTKKVRDNNRNVLVNVDKASMLINEGMKQVNSATSAASLEYNLNTACKMQLKEANKKFTKAYELLSDCYILKMPDDELGLNYDSAKTSLSNIKGYALQMVAMSETFATTQNDYLYIGSQLTQMSVHFKYNAEYVRMYLD